MAGDPDNVKRRFVDKPRDKALQIDRVPGGREVVDPKSDDPAKRFGLATEAIRRDADIDKLSRIASASKTFRKAREALRRKKITVLIRLDREAADGCGGRTFGAAKSPSRGIILWPPAVPEGFHILDVFIHEFGHVYEDHGGPDYFAFTKTVQAELGIRVTADTHGMPCDRRAAAAGAAP